MERGPQGKWQQTTTGGETVSAFIPNPLPPYPALALDNPTVRQSLDQALHALGGLGAVASVLPDPSAFLYAYVRKEAVLSSMIEGTQSSLSDLLLFELEEAPGSPMDDVTEVSNYVAALNEGIKLMRDGLPISVRLIKNVHAKLLASGRGSDSVLSPGDFRQSQNWIGGTRPGNAAFIPPPSANVIDCMSDLEKFIHDDEASRQPLVQAGLVHVQFETIHPFLDGNGRVGRLLIALQLCHSKLLPEPLLYLSLFFKKNRSEYYRLLDEVRLNGRWEEWLMFFAEAITVTSNQAVETVQRLQSLITNDRKQVRELGRSSGSATQTLEVFCRRPIANAKVLAEETKLSHPTINTTLRTLQELNIVQEVTGSRRGRVFAYAGYMDILNEGLELP